MFAGMDHTMFIGAMLMSEKFPPTWMFQRMVKAMRYLIPSITPVLYLHVLENIKKDKDGLYPFQRMSKEMHKFLVLPSGTIDVDLPSIECYPWHNKGILEVTSISRAKEIWDSFGHYGQGFPCEEIMMTKGIAITKQRKLFQPLGNEERQYLGNLWGLERNTRTFGHAIVYTKILFKGEVFHIGDHVVVKSNKRKDRKSTRLNSSHSGESRMPSSA